MDAIPPQISENMISSPTSVIPMKCVLNLNTTQPSKKNRLEGGEPFAVCGGSGDDARHHLAAPRTLHRKHRSSRRVRFSDGENDEEGNDHRRCVHEFVSDLSEDEAGQVWWSSNETFENYKRAKAEAASYRSMNQEYLDEFNQLFLLCGGDAEVHFRDIPSTKCAKVALHHQRAVRGLERYIHPVISTQRLKFIRSFLTLQSRLPTAMSKDDKHRYLCARSMQWSRPSRAMARVVAHGDRLEVGELIRQRSLERLP